MNLYLLEYNNYYNRTIKRENTLRGYTQYHQIGSVVKNVNFIPNDYITTSQIVNWYDADPDYVVVTDNEGNINSRWFVMSTYRTRKDQLRLDLRRDLVADYYAAIVDAPCFIEKATINNPNDPAIFNSENMSFNQILTDSVTLKDKSNCPWLVGYVARNASTFNKLNINYIDDLVSDYYVDNITELPFYKYLNNEYTNFSDIAIDLISTEKKHPNTLTMNSFNRYGNVILPAYNKNIINNTGFGFITTTSTVSTGYVDEMLSYLNKTAVYVDEVQIGTGQPPLNLPIYEFANKYFTEYIQGSVTISDWQTIQEQIEIYTNNSAVNEISKYINKIVKLSDGTYYRVRLQTTSADSTEYSSPISSLELPVIDKVIRSAYNRAIVNYKEKYPELASGMTNNVEITEPTSNNIMCTIRTSASTKAMLYLEKIKDTSLSAELTTSDSHVHLADAPYDMFCMPYSDDLVIVTENGGVKLEIQSSKALALATMNAIAREGIGAGKIHDIQLLPYCPLQQYITVDGKLDLTQSSSIPQDLSKYYFIQDKTGVGILGVFIYCDKSRGQFNIPYTIRVNDYKVQSQCDMYRLCSPNYSSVFEFNAAFNRGVEYFNVDFNYKPYSPYIHVNPNFKSNGLYGLDRNEPRGLICSGDFSITLISDAWETYELQNKNYEDMFNRQIQNMKVTHDVQRTQDILGGITGTLTGTAGGTAAGMMVGGPVGGLIGGTVGSLASGIGGIGDYFLNEKLRNEALSYMNDMHIYQMQNIQALPYTITKVSTFNPNNKIFPVLEYYTCTDIEKQALKNKMKYNGMTVMRIGTIREFMQEEPTYIKAKLIRLEDYSLINEDYHIINAIADEINKGVYL